MTLDTRIRVYDPVPARELFDECRRLLGATDRVVVEDDWGSDGFGESRSEDRGRRVMSHRPNQGLSAWLMMDYAVERPLPSEMQRDEWVRWLDKDEPEPQEPDHFACISFDTTYGYNRDGAGCGDLHAWLVREVGRWLSERGKRFDWYDECGGNWYASLNELHRIGNPDRGALLEVAR